MRLIDDLCFEDFIKLLPSKDFEKIKHLEIEMKALFTMLDSYEISNLSEENILEDLQWLSITLQAKKIIELWNK